MKTLLIILLTSASLYAQELPKVSIGNNSISLTSNNITPDKGFKILRSARNNRMIHYDKYVVINNITYYRPGITVMRRSRAYIYSNGNFEKVKIY